MATFSFDSQEMRAIIRGKATWRKCPDCSGTGFVYWEWEDETQKKSKDIDEASYNPDNELHGSQECDLCQSTGYLLVEIDLNE